MFTLNTNQLKFEKVRKTLSIPRDSFVFDGHFPDAVNVVSSHTGRTVKFVFDHEAAMNAEYWDGEQAEYVPTEPAHNVERLIIYNGE